MNYWPDLTNEQTYNSIIVIIGIVSVLISILGFILVLKSIRQNTEQKQAQLVQQQASIFLEYTKRYREICGENFAIISIYPHIKEPSEEERLAYNNFLPDLSSLIQQEFFLYRSGLISDEIWNLWRGYLKDDVKTKEFQEFWKVEREQNIDDKNFVDMVDELIRHTNK